MQLAVVITILGISVQVLVGCYTLAATLLSELHRLAATGIPTYSRSWTLADPANSNEGAATTGPGTAGRLSFYEVRHCLLRGYTLAQGTSGTTRNASQRVTLAHEVYKVIHSS